MRKWLSLLLLLALLLCGCAQEVPETTTPTETEEENLFVHFIDVGQADCTLLKYGDTEILIDAGNTADGHDVVNYLKFLGVEEIELVVATHPHEDHIGGLSLVLKQFPIQAIWTNTVFYDSYAYDALYDRIAEFDIPLTHPQPGHRFTTGQLELTVLGPVKENYKDINDTSIVVMAQLGEKKFLFTGDMESIAEKDLLNSGADVKADVLKVGHHGSYSSTSYSFLQAVDPDYALIHVGLNNEYGHPHDGPMNQLHNAQVQVYRTDKMSTVVAATDGDTIAFFWEQAKYLPTWLPGSNAA